MGKTMLNWSNGNNCKLPNYKNSVRKNYWEKRLPDDGNINSGRDTATNLGHKRDMTEATSILPCLDLYQIQLSKL